MKEKKEVNSSRKGWMPPRGRLTATSRGPVPPPPSRTPTRCSSICRVPKDRFRGPPAVAATTTPRSRESGSACHCVPLRRKNASNDNAFATRRTAIVDEKTPSPQKPVQPYVADERIEKMRRSMNGTNRRSCSESMRDAEPVSFHMAPYPRVPFVRHSSNRCESTPSSYRTRVSTAQQCSFGGHAARPTVAGTELLPRMPRLQGTHRTSKERGRATLERFLQTQPTDAQNEVRDLMKEYKGREEELCDALNIAFGESAGGVAMGLSTSTSGGATPVPRRYDIPQPYREPTPLKQEVTDTSILNTSPKLHSRSAMSATVRVNSEANPIASSPSPYRHGCSPRRTQPSRNRVNPRDGVYSQPPSGMISACTPISSPSRGRGTGWAKSLYNELREEGSLSPYLRYLPSDVSGGEWDKPDVGDVLCFQAKEPQRRRVLTSPVPDELLIK